MAFAVTELPDTRQSISRPIAMDIARKVGRLIRMPATAEVLFAGPLDEAMQSGSSLNYEGAPAKFPGHSRLQLDMTETYDDTHVFAENMMMQDAPTIFIDRGLGLRLRVGYVKANLTISFNIRSRSRTEAEKLRDEFRQRSAQLRRVILHDITYSYGIPDDMLGLLKAIYQMRENVAGYGDTFESWLKCHASPMLQEISAQNGNGRQWVFGETQNDVQGYFNFEAQTEAPDKAESTGTYNSPIEYTVTYAKALYIAADYQLINHSQLIDAKYHPRSIQGYAQDLPYKTIPRGTNSTMVMNALFNNHVMQPRMIDGLRSPQFDDWLPRAVPNQTTTIYATIVIPDENDFNDVLDLRQLQDVEFDPDIMGYLLSQGPKLGVLYQAAVHVELYKNWDWLGDDAITVSSDLKVRSTEPLCPRDRYHVRISVLNDLTMLPSDARLALRTQGAACRKIFLSMQMGMADEAYVPKLKGPGIVTDANFQYSAQRVNKFKGRFASGLEHVMLTVDYFYVTALNRNQEHAPVADTIAPAEPPISQRADYERSVPGHCCDCPTDGCGCAH